MQLSAIKYWFICRLWLKYWSHETVTLATSFGILLGFYLREAFQTKKWGNFGMGPEWKWPPPCHKCKTGSPGPLYRSLLTRLYLLDSLLRESYCNNKVLRVTQPFTKTMTWFCEEPFLIQPVWNLFFAKNLFSCDLWRTCFEYVRFSYTLWCLIIKWQNKRCLIELVSTFFHNYIHCSPCTKLWFQSTEPTALIGLIAGALANFLGKMVIF